MSSTTIRVSRALHRRLVDRAEEEKTTLAELIERALDAQEKADFWTDVESSMVSRRGSVESHQVEAERFSGSLKDGLDPDESWDELW